MTNHLSETNTNEQLFALPKEPAKELAESTPTKMTAKTPTKMTANTATKTTTKTTKKTPTKLDTPGDKANSPGEDDPELDTVRIPNS